jgi:hypothetical protein
LAATGSNNDLDDNPMIDPAINPTTKVSTNGMYPDHRCVGMTAGLPAWSLMAC